MSPELSVMDLLVVLSAMFLCGIIYVFIRLPRRLKNRRKRRKSSDTFEFSNHSPSFNAGRRNQTTPPFNRAPMSAIVISEPAVFESLMDYTMASVAWCCFGGAVYSVPKQDMVSKPNQDRVLAIPNFMNNPDNALFAVFDGHGDYGGEVADFILRTLPTVLSEELMKLGDPEVALKQAFLAVNQQLVDNTEIQSAFGGSTATVALLLKDKLWVANCGDSRAVLGRQADPNNEALTAVPLSQDQTPDVPSEKERIEKLGGFISKAVQPGLSSRVWLDRDHTMVGLAMSRSIGDLAVKKIGVIAEPDVIGISLTSKDRFLLLGSDGVFTFISNEEVTSILSNSIAAKEKKLSSKALCTSLMNLAASRWKEKVVVYRDDISALLVLFHQSK